MGRYLDPVCKLCRREGVKLYLKGDRCDTPKCAIERRGNPPGMHGFRRGKQSEYGVRLREKQKLKRFYGLMEKQFLRYFDLAAHSADNRGEALLGILERRLDNIVHRLGFAPSRAAARQLVSHGHIQLNGHKCDRPSLLVRTDDVVSVKNRPKSVQLVKLNLQKPVQPIPDFLEITASDPPQGRITRLPSKTDVDPRLTKDKPLEENLIIEFCSR